MTNRDVLYLATTLLGESSSSPSVSDYSDRAASLIQIASLQLGDLDTAYRQAFDLSERTDDSSAPVLTGTFALCDALIPATAFFLAAMLAVDENEELSQRLMTLYEKSLAQVKNSIPCVREPITDRYGLSE